MAQNRKGVHVLAEASGLTYAEVRLILHHIMLNTPTAGLLARDFVTTIQGGALERYFPRNR